MLFRRSRRPEEIRRQPSRKSLARVAEISRVTLIFVMPFIQRGVAWGEKYFEFAALGTTWKTECLAGVTTFMTMAYIIFVNPSILHETGMPIAGVTAATCLAAAIGSILMGAFARYPIALAPGMGLNAYFTYSVVARCMGVDWHVALGAVFLSGVAFLILTAAGVRQMIVTRHPARTVFRGGGGRRPVHRAHRLPQRRHHRPGPVHHCHARRPAQAGSSPLPLRTARDGGAHRRGNQVRDPDRRSRHLGARSRHRNSSLATVSPTASATSPRPPCNSTFAAR